MDPPARVGPVRRAHEGRQGIHVGALQLRELAVFEDEARQFVERRELFENVRPGGRLSGLLRLSRVRELQLVEEHLSELLRTRDVERASGELVDVRLERRHPPAELGPEGFEDRDVERDAAEFHPREDRKQRHLDPGEDAAQSFLVEQLVELPGEPVLPGGAHREPLVGSAAGEEAGLRRFRQRESGVVLEHRSEPLGATGGVQKPGGHLRVVNLGRRPGVGVEQPSNERLDAVPAEAHRRRGLSGVGRRGEERSEERAQTGLAEPGADGREAPPPPRKRRVPAR